MRILFIKCLSFVLFLHGLNCAAVAQAMAKMDTKNIFLLSMDKMMINMDKAPKGKSVADDYLEQMIPHHQGAIMMAETELRSGKDFKMRQLAKSIIVEQKSEIQQMQLWLKHSDMKKGPLPAGYQLLMGQIMQLMMKNMPGNSELKHTDHAFARVMIPHHEAAIGMSGVVIKYSEDPQTLSFAKQLISTEQVEIEQMSSFLNE